MHTPLRFKLCVLSSIALLGLLLTADTWAAQPAFSLPPHAKEIAENICDLGYAIHHGRQVGRSPFQWPAAPRRLS